MLNFFLNEVEPGLIHVSVDGRGVMYIAQRSEVWGERWRGFRAERGPGGTPTPGERVGRDQQYRADLWDDLRDDLCARATTEGECRN